MKATVKRRTKSEAELLDSATNSLLRALKRDMIEKDGRIDRNKLRKDGYSERLLDRVETAWSSFIPLPTSHAHFAMCANHGLSPSE